MKRRISPETLARINELAEHCAPRQLAGCDIGDVVADYLSQAEKEELIHEYVLEVVTARIRELVNEGKLIDLGNGAFRRAEVRP